MRNWRPLWLRPRAASEAFTLVEIMFSIVILAVAVTTVMGLLAAGARRQGLERDREIANQLAVAIGEAAYFAPPTEVSSELMQRALNAGGAIVELPEFLAARIRSPDGSLERAVALGNTVVYIGAFLAGQTIDPLQLRVIAAFVTPDGEATVPSGANWSPALASRTLVCWSVDWCRLYEFEFFDEAGGYSDRNNNSQQDFGPLVPGSSVVAVEVGRFNLYDPHVALSLSGTVP